MPEQMSVTLVTAITQILITQLIMV